MRPSINRDAIPVFVWSGWGKPWKYISHYSSCAVPDRTEYRPNASLQRTDINRQLGTDCFKHKGNTPADEKAQFVSDKMQVRGLRCDIAPNVHASTEDKSDDTKVSLYEEIERAFIQFIGYSMEILLDSFSTR
jgi:hypothetical protein